MSVAVPASQSVGPDGLYIAQATVKVDAPKIAAPEESGRQPDSREQNHDQPQDHLSQQLQVLARRAEQMNKRQQELQQKQDQQQSGSSNHPSSDTSQRASTVAVQGSSRPAATRVTLSDEAAGPDQVIDSTATPVGQDKGSANDDPIVAAMERAQRFRDNQPGPAEIYGLPDALQRYDSNGDGRIDQIELQQVVRAKDQSSSYSGLGRVEPSTPEEQKAQAEIEQPKKLYANEAPPLPPLPGQDNASEQTTAEQDAGQEVLLPGEQRVLDQQSGIPRRLYEPVEDPPAKQVAGTYQQIANGPPDHTSIVT
ncbi:EF-hand domain-containing protein [Insolitispirillum peregrinum]|uniref:EF-hand domain-containing protein n=1 Tax=Insolitispirillum peregrinum TaxID=80876 RepID=A0A1N7LUG8_9PROT|nr:EF-hand domain-containing protein [Insolitispirillum peregrinum]SIS77476.1 hypothetical protein SAMN05421779_103562 [Insolitispirillum peregrinum]